jgi:dolichol-phosphate mannosyltransferase
MVQAPARTSGRQERDQGTGATALPAFDVSLVIPTRNEEQNLPALLAKLAEVLRETSYEIILVDDSDDATAQVAPRLAAEHGLNLSVIHREGDERQGGLSTAVLAGVAAAYGDYVCIMDADLQHPPELIADMIEAARRGDTDIIIASRYVEGGSDAGLSSSSRRLISFASKRLVKTVFRGRLRSVSDPLSGFFLARRSLLNKTALRPIGFKILLDILVRSNWRLTEEVPLRFERRAAGASKATLHQGRDFLSHVTRLFWEVRAGTIESKQPGLVTGKTQAQVTQTQP